MVLRMEKIQFGELYGWFMKKTGERTRRPLSRPHDGRNVNQDMKELYRCHEK